MRWKALAEIYTMHSFAPLWNPLTKNGEKRAWPKQPRKGRNEMKWTSYPALKIEIRERCKGVHCVDLGKSFPTSIYLQKSASIQPRTSPSKFGEKFNSLFTSLLNSDPAWCPPLPHSKLKKTTRHSVCCRTITKFENFRRLVLGCIDADFCK